MKKLLSVLLSILLIISTVFSGALVNAATTDVTITLSAGSAVNVGNNITVNVNAAGTAFAAAVLDFSFDASALRLSSVTSPAGFDDCSFFQTNTGARVLLVGGSNLNGNVATLTFETLKSGSFALSLNSANSSFSNLSGNVLVGSDATANLTVNCTHNFVFSHVEEPTCSKEGEFVYICSICGEKDPNAEKIPKTSCMAGETRVLVAPDCTNTGIKQTYCAVCDKPYGDPQVIPANGHSFGEWMIDELPTCSKEGLKVHFCQVCGEEFAENISKSEHDSSAENATWIVYTPASCGAAGTEALVCNLCGEIKETRAIAAVENHDYVMAVTKEATCKEDGEYSEVCRICGHINQTQKIEKLEHTPGRIEEVKASCTQDGSKNVYCATCGELYESTTEKGKHKYAPLNIITAPTNILEGKATQTCTVCGHTENVTLNKTNAYLGAENLLLGKIEAAKTIKLAVSIENSQLFYAGVFEVNYDSAVLEYVGYQANGIDVTVNASENGKIIVVITADKKLNDGKIIDLLFDAKIKGGNTDITITNAKFSDGENDVFFNLQNGSVDIISVIDGDVNGDGIVDIVDFGVLKKYVAGIIRIENEAEADVNYDGKVNITDLAILKKAVSGLLKLD